MIINEIGKLQIYDNTGIFYNKTGYLFKNVLNDALSEIPAAAGDNAFLSEAADESRCPCGCEIDVEDEETAGLEENTTEFFWCGECEHRFECMERAKEKDDASEYDSFSISIRRDNISGKYKAVVQGQLAESEPLFDSIIYDLSRIYPVIDEKKKRRYFELNSSESTGR